MKPIRLSSICFSFISIILFHQHSLGQKLQPLKISADKRYLITQDDNPFFWLGGTAWELIHRLNRDEVDKYLKDRAEKGFTVIQTVILAELDGLNTPNAYGFKPLIDNDPTQINEEYFKHVDYVVKKAKKHGLYVGLLPTWGDKFNLKWGVGPEIFTPQNAEVYGEILASRYLKQNNIIWILGGDRMPEKEEHYEIIRAMAKGIRKIDQTHLMTYHPAGARRATDSLNEAWLDFDMFQSGHDRRTREYKFVQEALKVTPKRPIIDGEPRYENIQERFWEKGEYDWMDDSDVRATAYWSMLSGAAGYTYGCNDIWQIYTMLDSPIIKARTGWQEALHLPGSKQMKYMKDLLTSFPWQSMNNDQSLILSDNPENQEHIVASIGAEKDFILTYTPWGRSFSIDLSQMKSQKVVVYWFNPRSGKRILIGNFDKNEKPIWKFWTKGRGSDMVLVVLAEGGGTEFLERIQEDK